MRAVVTAREMAGYDRAAITGMGIPGVVLMENAGRGTAAIAVEMLGVAVDKTVLIVCGPGNNGGDGYVVARHLHNAGARVEVWVLAERDKISGDAATHLQIWQHMGGALRFLTTLPQTLSPRPDLIIDAMLGTGVQGAPRGLIAAAIPFLNQLGVPLLAVDIPTGIDADSGAVAAEAINARVTATMALLKRGLLFSPARECAGSVRRVDIGMPAEVLKQNPPRNWQITAGAIRKRLPRRCGDAHKNSVGTLAILAGSRGFTGAAALTAQAALRGGSGLVYLAVPSSLQALLAAKLTEIITWPFEDSGSGYLLEADYHTWREALRKQDALALGPGLGTHPATAGLVHRILREHDRPLVLDADGLNVCADHLDLIAAYAGEMVLTPHPGELARLLKTTAAEIAQRRFEAASETARKLGKVVLLKGGPTLVAAPDGQLYINSSGNAGMATAGSGDVLTGLIAALLCQGLRALDAALCGVFLHGRAGDCARQIKGEMSLTAGDLIDHLPDAIQKTQTGTEHETE